MNGKRVLIISYYFWPENNPRSCRAFDLARQLSCNSHEVTIVTKRLGVRRAIESPIEIREVPVWERAARKCLPPGMGGGGRSLSRPPATRQLPKKIQGMAKRLGFWKALFWPALWQFEFAWRGCRLARQLKREPGFDLAISIAMPMASHLLARRLAQSGVSTGTLVADYGDPFTFNPNNRFSRIDFAREKRLVASFDHVVIPTPLAREAFLRLGVAPDTIEIIPQGFSYDSGLKIRYSLPPACRKGLALVYGGAFIEKIRSPENFFEALCLLRKRGEAFHCCIFTDLDTPYVAFLIEKYRSRLKGHVSFSGRIARNDYLDVIRQADYCLNFVNRSAYQVPSKLIDFARFKVATIDIHMSMTPEDIAEKIVRRDSYVPPSNPATDIQCVAEKFISLAR